MSMALLVGALVSVCMVVAVVALGGVSVAIDWAVARANTLREDAQHNPAAIYYCIATYFTISLLSHLERIGDRIGALRDTVPTAMQTMREELSGLRSAVIRGGRSQRQYAETLRLLRTVMKDVSLTLPYRTAIEERLSAIEDMR